MQLAGTTTLVPDVPVPYALIGTAIDYRVRYYFEVTPCDALVAWHGAMRLGWPPDYDTPGTDPRTGGPLEGMSINFFPSLDETLQKLRPVRRRLAQPDEAQLNRYCFVLALLEQIFRRGYIEESLLLTPTPKSTVAELLAIAEGAWIDDLCQLSWAFYDTCSNVFARPFILNPTFDGSLDVGGADADLIVDSCLIEVKTTKYPKLDSRWLYKLLGYVLLDYSDRLRIQSVAVYMARQQKVLRWSLDELMRAMMAEGGTASLDQIRADFNRVASGTRRRPGAAG